MPPTPRACEAPRRQPSADFRRFVGLRGRGRCIDGDRREAMILVVGYPGDWAALRRNVRGDQLRFVPFSELTPRLLRELTPFLLVAPLMGDGFDAVDVAHRLDAAAFQGRFRVLSPPIPEPDAVRAEIQEAAGRIDVDLMILSHRLT